jgi:hypothetical protein
MHYHPVIACFSDSLPHFSSVYPVAILVKKLPPLSLFVRSWAVLNVFDVRQGFTDRYDISASIAPWYVLVLNYDHC